MKCHDALIYPYKVLLCNSFFSPFSKGQYLSLYVLYFHFSHVAQHACRLRCPSSLVGSCLCLILPFFLYLQKASGFRVMVAISVAHLVLFLQKIYGIHICSSIGTGYSLQIKKFHFFPYHSPSSYSHGWALAMRFHLSWAFYLSFPFTQTCIFSRHFPLSSGIWRVPSRFWLVPSNAMIGL